jgi:hypothetical protein
LFEGSFFEILWVTIPINKKLIKQPQNQAKNGNPITMLKIGKLK